MKKAIAMLLIGLMSASTVIGGTVAYGNENNNDKILAFPGAEGGGRFTSGGRGCEVYIVDTLEDYIPDEEEPIKGSFRDAVSQDNRTIVFNVSGVIKLKDRLLITDRKNLTIAGQTAPGDGITLYGFETNISRSENIIIRYVRFRPGAENVFKGDSMDAIWGRSMKNVMVDHISTSWSTDETMSLYRAENMTVQWSVIEESLAMSGHTKGRHGYGAIWGGVNTTYHHNLIANHTSRNPRMGGGTPEADDNDHIARFDMRNNVLYNWGYNTIYGGGRAEANYINNYVKAGPGTRDEVKDRLIDCGEKNKPGFFYVNGNYMEGNEEISADNSKGIYISEDSKPFTTISDTEFEMEGTKSDSLNTQTPKEAYKEVLEKAGAVYPKRDALDARIINEVKTGTGRFANTDKEVGGLPYLESEKRADDFDKDKDGIADEWELANGLDPTNPEDSKELAKDNSGYTNLENYLNSLVDMEHIAENPQIEMTSPSNNEIVEAGKAVTISAKAESKNGIEKVDFYNGADLIGTATEEPFEITVDDLKDGSYFISAKATDKNGNQTQASAVALHINTKTDNGKWLNKDIGEPEIQGATEVIDDEITVKGSGKLKDNNDSFQFAYQTLVGDGEITAKLESITAVDNHAFAGLMIRENLGKGAKTAALGLSHTKAYEWKETDPITQKSTSYYRNAFSCYLATRNEDNGKIDDLGENLDSIESATKSGVQLLNDIAFKDEAKFLGYYLKLNRTGNIFTAYISPDGKEWTKLGEEEIKMAEKVYIGFAVDSNKVNNELNNYNTAKFTDVELKGSSTKNGVN